MFACFCGFSPACQNFTGCAGFKPQWQHPSRISRTAIYPLSLMCPFNLVAPYCALLWDYLSDNPLLRAMGLWVSQQGQIGCDTPCPSVRTSWCAIPPHQKSISAMLVQYHVKNMANTHAITPLCDTISKGCCATWEGISNWAAMPFKRSPNKQPQEEDFLGWMPPSLAYHSNTFLQFSSSTVWLTIFGLQ